MTPKSTAKILLLSAATASTFTLQAANWLGNDGAYTAPDQWDTATVPAVTDEIAINAGLATNTGNLTRNAVTNLSGTGALTVNGRFISGNAVNISGSAVLSVTGNYFLVGNTSIGTLTQTGGSVVATLDRGFFLSDNTAQGGSSYQLLGGTLQITNNGTDSNIDLFAVHFGKGGSGDSFLIDGGTATFNSVTASRNVWLSRNSTVHLISGSASFSGYDNFTIGHGGTAAGTSHLWIEGGDFQVKDLLNSFILGDVENGHFTLAGGTAEIAANILLGGTAGKSGIFDMSGGILTATDITAGLGNPLFNFSGGEIILSGDRTSILNEPWFNEIAGTEAIYDSGTNLTHVTVPEPSSLTLLAIPAMLCLTRRARRARLAAV